MHTNMSILRTCTHNVCDCAMPLCMHAIRYFRNAFVKDDFIGRAFFRLSDITQSGAEHVLILTSHSEKTIHGKLHLLLNREAEHRKLSDKEVRSATAGLLSDGHYT